MPDPVPQAELTQLEFKLAVPFSSKQAVKTYAIEDRDENAIQQIILLAFKVDYDDGAKEKFVYYRTGMQIYSTSEASVKSFYTWLPKSKDTFRFVLLVNGGEDISDIVEGIEEGAEKNAVISDLVMDVVTGEIDDHPGWYTGWNAASSTDFAPLPMWGESDVVPGIYANTVLPSVKLLRSLARIDVKLGGDVAADFIIESVNIVEANTRVRIAPEPDNYYIDEDDDDKLVITAPSLPGDLGPLNFKYTYTGPLTALEREIYLPEAGIGTTRIVVGLIRDGETDPEYFEVVLGAPLGAPIPILRNNKYTINITKVDGTGVPLEDLMSVHVPDQGVNDRNFISSTRLKGAGGLTNTITVTRDE